MVYGLLLALVLAPILIPGIPPFYDALNHLARARILSVYDHDPFYRAIYATNWRVLPNLALDVSLVALCRIVPPLIALKLYLAATVILLTAGYAALHRTIYGRFSLAALGGFLLVFTLSMFMGLMNFVFGIGLGFVFCAAYLALRGHSPAVRLTVTGALALLLFFSHLLAFLFALLFLAVLAFCAEDRWRYGKAWRPFAELAAVALAPSVLYVFVSPTRGEVDVFYWREWYDKIAAFGSLFRSGAVAVDLVAIPLMYAGLCTVLSASWRRRAPFVLPLLVLTTLIFLVAPFGSKTTQILDARLPIFMMVAVLLAAPPDLFVPPISRRAALAAALFAASLLIQGIGLTVSYLGVQGDYRALAAVYRDLPSHSKVFGVSYRPLYDRRFGPLEKRHTNSSGFATVVGDNYATGIFTIPNQQPLVHRPGSIPYGFTLTSVGDPHLPVGAVTFIEDRLRDAGRAGETAYLHFATLPDVAPQPMVGCDLLLARPGIGVYRIRSGWR